MSKMNSNLQATNLQAANLQAACKSNALSKGRCGLIAVSTIPDAGLGLFATKTYKKGDYICIYGGEYVNQGRGGEYVLELNGKLCVDAQDPSSYHYLDLGRNVNHQSDPKLVNTKYKIRDVGSQPVAFIEATKSILPGEELFVNYGPVYPKNGMKKPFTKEDDNSTQKKRTESQNYSSNSYSNNTADRKNKNRPNFIREQMVINW